MTTYRMFPFLCLSSLFPKFHSICLLSLKINHSLDVFFLTWYVPLPFSLSIACIYLDLFCLQNSHLSFPHICLLLSSPKKALQETVLSVSSAFPLSFSPIQTVHLMPLVCDTSRAKMSRKPCVEGKTQVQSCLSSQSCHHRTSSTHLPQVLSKGPKLFCLLVSDK